MEKEAIFSEREEEAAKARLFEWLKPAKSAELKNYLYVLLFVVCEPEEREEQARWFFSSLRAGLAELLRTELACRGWGPDELDVYMGWPKGRVRRLFEEPTDFLLQAVFDAVTDPPLLDLRRALDRIVAFEEEVFEAVRNWQRPRAHYG